jgi:predicted site-specific integrase-resolvase
MNNVPDGYLDGKDTRLYSGFSVGKLLYWANNGKIRYTKDENGRRYYLKEDVDKLERLKDMRTFTYARSMNEERLQEQMAYLLLRVDGKHLHDQASSHNTSRSGFQHLLEKIVSGDVETLFVTSIDRLGQGMDVLKVLLKEHNVKLISYDLQNYADIVDDAQALLEYSQRLLVATKNRMDKKIMEIT